jgi:hypothetical protein
VMLHRVRFSGSSLSSSHELGHTMNAKSAKNAKKIS